MADYGAKYADKKIRKVDRQLQAEYRQAEIELKKKLADFVRRSKAQDIYKRKQVQAGIITEKEYQSWLKGQVFQKERWEAKVRQIEKIMHNHNEVAARIVHENKLDVYDENYLRQSWEMNGITGYSFDFSNEQTISNLIKNRDKLLPEWKIDEEKDYKWNYQKANNAITQGIIQGESVEKVMKRLTENLCTQNENKMRMFARTAINAAQSAGRQQQMADAEKEFGIKQLKQWLATLDMRTRDAHRHLDGDEVGIHESFKSDLGEIRFPGDPDAEPANVYNCRCTIITIYPEYRTEQDNWRENETIDGQTYEEWKEPVRERIKVIQTGGKYAVNSKKWIQNQKEREFQAENYYEKARHTDDIQQIARASKFTVKQVKIIKDHIFYDDKHKLYDGVGRFPADYDMAVAWKRLTDGKPEERDILLLKHELLEARLEKRYNLSVAEAHAIAKKRYPWDVVLEEMLGEDGEEDGLLQEKTGRK